MEVSKYRMFNNFGIISVLIPYYGSTHKCFLLLSSLCTNSRRKLDEYYSEFRRIMYKYISKVEIDFQNLQRFDLPCDLFEFKITSCTRETVTGFVTLLDNISNKKGCYLNSNYMHEIVSISDFVIDEVYCEELIPYIDVIKSISHEHHNIYFCQMGRKSLIDRIIINPSYVTKKGTWKLQLDIYRKKNELKGVYKYFKRISKLCIDEFHDFENDFQSINKASIFIENITLFGECSQEFKNSNPELVSGKVKECVFEFKSIYEIKNQIFEKIIRINPSSICLKSIWNVDLDFDYVDIFRKISNHTNLKLGNYDPSEIAKLTFTNLDVRVFSFYSKESILMHCKRIEVVLNSNPLKLIKVFNFSSEVTENQILALHLFLNNKINLISIIK